MTSRRYIAAANVAVLLLASCTTLRTSTQLQPVDHQVEREVVEGAGLSATTATDVNGNLVLTLVESDTCRERTVTTYDRTEVTRGNKGAAVAAAAIGALFAVSAAGLGIWAATLPKEVPEDDPDAVPRKNALVGVGVSGGAAGIGFTWAAVEGIRARKRERPAGQETKTGGWQDEPCSQRALAKEPVDVLVGDVLVTSASTDANGHLSLPLDQVTVALAESDSGLTVRATGNEATIYLGDGVAAKVAQRKTNLQVAGADALAEEARAAIEAGDAKAGKDKARECLRLVVNHPPCLEASRLAICEMAISETDRDVESRYESIENLDDDGSEAVKTCVAKAKKSLGPAYKKAVGARHFIYDTSGTYDALWNYVLAKHLKGRSVGWQAEYEASEIVRIIPRDVCPIWKQAIKDYGKQHLDAAIAAYCADGDFPHQIQNNISGVTTTLTVNDCKETLGKMCRW